MQYILGIDQSTQGTKAILTDADGKMIGRADRAHRQIVDAQGWISHDLEEIYANVLAVSEEVICRAGIEKSAVKAVGISNQRETSAIWSRDGKPLNHAVVWQCSRAREITAGMQEYAEMIRQKTGLKLSPYFPAAKMAWLLSHTKAVGDRQDICLGTMDSWLIYRMTEGACFKTDYSNASRTQLFDIHRLAWDEEICLLFGIPIEYLPKVCDSDSVFGMTDLGGVLERKIPIHAVMGDSHAALFGQGCHRPGMVKATYGTGSSVMMNTGGRCVGSEHGLVTSLAWGIGGTVDYVLEGNINYTGAVITWLKDDVKLMESPSEAERLAKEANPNDETVLVPAFSGLGAPYWKNDAKAMLYGMTRTTGKREFVKAALQSIALQIYDVMKAMEKDSGVECKELRADGGPARNGYLMQLQSDLTDTTVAVAKTEELSALGASYLAGIGSGLYQKEQLFAQKERVYWNPQMDGDQKETILGRWREAVALVMR